MVISKEVYKTLDVYNRVKGDLYEFLEKLNKDDMEMVITETEDIKKTVSLIECDGVNSLHRHGMEDTRDEEYIKIVCKDLKTELDSYGEHIQKGVRDYDNIKERIAIRLMREDSRTLSEYIIKIERKICVECVSW